MQDSRRAKSSRHSHKAEVQERNDSIAAKDQRGVEGLRIRWRRTFANRTIRGGVLEMEILKPMTDDPDRYLEAPLHV